MQGRKTSDKKIDMARELRRNGLSVREIARRLNISKSAAHRLTVGISWEEEVPSEHEEETKPAPEEKTWGGTELLFAHMYYASWYNHAIDTHNELTKRWAKEKLSRVVKELDERVKRSKASRAERASRQAEGLLPAGGMESEPGTSAEQVQKEELPQAEPIDEELASLGERLWNIKAREYTCRPGDEREIGSIQREHDRLGRDLQRYWDRRLRSVGCHSPAPQFTRNRFRDHVPANPQTSHVTSRDDCLEWLKPYELEQNARIEAWERRLQARERRLVMRIWDTYAS